MIERAKAYIRLKEMESRKTDFECTKNTILKHIKSKFPDPLDQVKVLDMVGMDLQDSIYRDLKKNEHGFLSNEKALDNIKMLNLRIH